MMSKSNFNQVSNGNTNVHFSRALFGEVESSRMTATPEHLTTFNAGDLVPIYCREILPDESISMSIDFVIRQTTLLTPTMGSMSVDIYAYFVPNRIVNRSWKAVEGENFSGSWTANSVSLAPLVSDTTGTTTIPVGSVADYYGFPTQQPIPNSVMSLCHDLKFRGYVFIWNEYFRDQNYQPPIPISYLNVFNGFFNTSNTVMLAGDHDPLVTTGHSATGAYGSSAILEGVYGEGSKISANFTAASRVDSSDNLFRAYNPPLKVNKFHDYFTSVLPSPQKSSSSIFAPVTGSISSVPVITSDTSLPVGSGVALRMHRVDGSSVSSPFTLGVGAGVNPSVGLGSTLDSPPSAFVYPSNLQTQPGAEVTGLALSVDDIRMASAIQQVYEVLARGGSRYREIVSSFFGIEVDDPYDDVPKCLGHISRGLDLFQTAQTSASETGSTAQGNLAAFGYTSSGGKLFEHRFIEHGYLHIFAVVRHRNVYSSFMARDNFRLNMLDFYTPPLANISEQPVYTREINPFASDPNGAFGYQEAWAEYRYEPDQVSGLMRPGVEGSLSLWNYADDFDSGLQISTGAWLKSNSEEVLNRSLAVTSSLAPQFKGQFRFYVDKTLPMPTYSVPGMDII